MGSAFLKNWEHLSASRRGWALGSIFGLFMTALYFFGPATWGHHGGINLSSFLAVPATLGILCAESLLADLPRSLFAYGPLPTRIAYVATAGLVNYIFWGSYCYFLYRTLQSGQLSGAPMAFFSLFMFFCSVVGIAYSLNSGVRFNQISTSLFILLTALLLALLSIVPLFSYLAGRERPVD
jgi:hypothetical protein